ncbi:MAG: alpha/beta fold hydrolase [Thermomicrobiales bacterium]
MTSAPVTSSTISVPGATLYYEIRGSGPTLLIIPGGPQDAGVFSGFANLLADRYTVVTYDPRGNSRSPVEDTSADQRVELHADAGSIPRRSRTWPGRESQTLNLGRDQLCDYLDDHWTILRRGVVHPPPPGRE